MSEATTPAPAAKRPPTHVLALKAVGASSLSSSEKTVLMTMLRWWNPVSGALWPSISSIATGAGLSVRGVQKIIRRLEALDVVRRVIASMGGVRADNRGRTNRFELHLAALPRSERPAREHKHRESVATIAPQRVIAQPTATDNPEQCAGALPERRSVEPRTAVRENPEPRSYEPSSHEDSKGTFQSGRVPAGDMFVHSQVFMAGWKERSAAREPVAQAAPREEAAPAPANEVANEEPCAPTSEASTRDRLRAALRIASVRGVNLELLSASGTLTLQQVALEVRDIQRDPRARNVAAVLVGRLARVSGVALPTRPKLSDGDRRAVEKIEALRRAMGLARGA